VTSPGSAETFGGRPVRSLSLLDSRVARRRALVGGRPHLVFGKGQGMRLAGFLAPVEKTAAQERQFLYANAIPSRRREIGSNSTLSTDPIFADAFKCEHAGSQIVSESGENELHL